MRTGPDGPGRARWAFESHLLHHPHDQRITRLVLCVIWSASHGSAPLALGASSDAPHPEGACRIVWMISHDAMSPAEHLTAAAPNQTVDHARPSARTPRPTPRSTAHTSHLTACRTTPFGIRSAATAPP